MAEMAKETSVYELYTFVGPLDSKNRAVLSVVIVSIPQPPIVTG